MALLYISEHALARSVDLIQLPPLRSYELELKDDAESIAEQPPHQSAEIIRLYPEMDCTVLFDNSEIRLAANTVHLFAIQQNSSTRVKVKAID